MSTERDVNVPHEAAVGDAVDQELKDLSTHGPIADLSPASGTYVQAEATATRTTLNAVLAVLRDAGLFPTT